MALNHTAEALEYLEVNGDWLVGAVTSAQVNAEPDFVKRFGRLAKIRCSEDNRYHFHYLCAAIAAADTSLFADYCGWVKAVLKSRGIDSIHLAKNLECWRNTLLEDAKPEIADLAVPYVDVALVRLDSYPDEPPIVTVPASTDSLVAEYVQRIVALDGEGAYRLIENRVHDADSMLDVFENVLRPAQRQIGRLWQTNMVSVAVEHYCSSTTQRLLMRLSHAVRPSRHLGLKLVGICVDGEHHCLGLQMVCDLARVDGWETIFVGANTPLNAAVSMVSNAKPAVVAVSVTTLLSLRNARALVARINEALPDAFVLAGGYALNLTPDLWRSIGVDGYAPDAASALKELRQIENSVVSESPASDSDEDGEISKEKLA